MKESWANGLSVLMFIVLVCSVIFVASWVCSSLSQMDVAFTPALRRHERAHSRRDTPMRKAVEERRNPQPSWPSTTDPDLMIGQPWTPEHTYLLVVVVMVIGLLGWWTPKG